MDINSLKDKNLEIAKLIGIDNYILLVRNYGGGYIYIPTFSSLMRETNAAEIKRQYNGDNAAELGKKYGCSARTIVRIVTKKPER